MADTAAALVQRKPQIWQRVVMTRLCEQVRVRIAPIFGHASLLFLALHQSYFWPCINHIFGLASLFHLARILDITPISDVAPLLL